MDRGISAAESEKWKKKEIHEREKEIYFLIE